MNYKKNNCCFIIWIRRYNKTYVDWFFWSTCVMMDPWTNLLPRAAGRRLQFGSWVHHNTYWPQTQSRNIEDKYLLDMDTFFIRLSWDGTYYGIALSICLSRPCRQDKDQTICFRVIQLGTLDHHHDKRNSFFKVKGQGCSIT
jgi:hypothetical protein